MSTFSILLSTGTRLENLTMNGSMFVSQTEIDKEVLSDEALSHVIVTETDGETTEHTVIENAVCDAVLHWPEGYMFNVRPLTAEEVTIKEQAEQIEMLTECVLEMSEIIYGGEL